MIIARIRGGLGNQLFQYAAARSLAWHKGETLKLDLYTYERNNQRKFELGSLKIDAEIATRNEIHQFTGSNPLIRFLNKRENYLKCVNVFSQPHYHFYEDFFSIQPPVYLSGYWQSENYFLNYTKELREQFVLKRPVSNSSLQWIEKIEKVEGVSIHVRRGDYSSNQSYRSFFSLIPLEYYREAVKEIVQRVANPKFFVFSDDPTWCKQNLSMIPDATFVKHNQNIIPFEDIYLMSRCKHNIIANSTFSWWGAWLNSNSEKVVIAPKQWFGKTFSDLPIPTYACRYYNTKDLLPKNWITK